MTETGLNVDGFSGSDGAGVGVVNSTVFSAGLALPTASAPGGMLISMQAYDPDDEAPAFLIPDHPLP